MKYRVFSKALGVYLNQSITKLDGNGNLEVNGVPVLSENYVIEASTGKTDRNGQEIYFLKKHE